MIATFGLRFLSPANANLLLDRQVNAIVGVDATDFRPKRTCRLRGKRRLERGDPSEDLFKSCQPGSKIGHRRLQRGHAIEERFVGGGGSQQQPVQQRAAVLIPRA